MRACWFMDLGLSEPTSIRSAVRTTYQAKGGARIQNEAVSETLPLLSNLLQPRSVRSGRGSAATASADSCQARPADPPQKSSHRSKAGSAPRLRIPRRNLTHTHARATTGSATPEGPEADCLPSDSLNTPYFDNYPPDRLLLPKRLGRPTPVPRSLITKCAASARTGPWKLRSAPVPVSRCHSHEELSRPDRCTAMDCFSCRPSRL